MYDGDTITVWFAIFTNCFHIIMQAKSICLVWYWSNQYMAVSPISTQIGSVFQREKQEKRKQKIYYLLNKGANTNQQQIDAVGK